jgi:hypothetical protein
MRSGSQCGIKPRVEFVECQPALREVLTEGRGSRVSVSIANAHVGCWCLMIFPGRPGQLPQHGDVAIQRDPAVAGEGDSDLRQPIPACPAEGS